MKNIIIIGARGLGRTIHNYIEEFEGYKKEFNVKGFLDDNKSALDMFSDYSKILCSVEEYQVCEDDLFICALGENQYRKKYSQLILNKGGKFMTLIHPLARIAKDAFVGNGCIIGPWSVVESGAKVSDFCLIQTSAIVGHDVFVGEWSRLDSHAICAGKAVIGKNVTIFTGAIINQNAIVGDDSTVGAGSFVMLKVNAGKTAFGNPAREF